MLCLSPGHVSSGFLATSGEREQLLRIYESNFKGSHRHLLNLICHFILAVTTTTLHLIHRNDVRTLLRNLAHKPSCQCNRRNWVRHRSEGPGYRSTRRENDGMRNQDCTTSRPKSLTTLLDIYTKQVNRDVGHHDSGYLLHDEISE